MVEMPKDDELSSEMAAEQGDHVGHPGPAGEAGDDAQFRKIHRHLVEVTGVADVVGAIVGIGHRRVDADGDVELDAFGIERIVASVGGGETVVEGDDAEAADIVLAHQALEVAHTGHAVERAGGG